MSGLVLFRVVLAAGFAAALVGCDKINPDFDAPGNGDSESSGGVTTTSTTTSGTTQSSAMTTTIGTSSTTTEGTGTSTTEGTSDGTMEITVGSSSETSTSDATTDATTTEGSTTDGTTTDTTTSTTTSTSTSGGTMEGSPCASDGQCGGDFPLCGPDGCQDGDEGDNCNSDLDCGVAAPMCGGNSTCQDGSEGDACNGAGDCSVSTPICSTAGECQDGSEGDDCSDAGDCSVAICSTAGSCQDGSEGDACGAGADCSGSASICASAGQCQDGSSGDDCADTDDCQAGLVCGGTCESCSGLTDVDVVTDVSHTFVSDLVIKLVSAEGSVQTLVSIPGGNETGDDGVLTNPEVGSPANVDGPITFDDSATHSSELMGNVGLDPTAVAPATTWTNQIICVDSGICEFYSSGFEDTSMNLTNLNGENPSGDWNLCVADSITGDLGTLHQWQLVLTCAEGTVTLDSGVIDYGIPDNSYNGTIGSMTCAPLSF